MILRRLDISEHWRTKELWREAFPEDSDAFVEYYYTFKTANNEIYVIEDDCRILSMLHLNPYRVRIGKNIFDTHYIVGVATLRPYRRQGFMRRLLCHAMEVMGKRGEPFTFLMPASDLIYRPFGFSYIYSQKERRITGVKNEDVSLKYVNAGTNDLEGMAGFANDFLKQYDITTLRDIDYYRVILKEQASEDGGVLLAKKRGRIEGIFCYSNEDGMEIREPMCHDDLILRQAVYHLTGNDSDLVLCTGCERGEKKPAVMAKVLCPELVGDISKASVFLNEIV